MRKIISAAALILITMAVSCNLDSSQGIYQKAFYDTPKDDITIQNILGVYGNSILVYGNDIYSFSGTNPMKLEINMHVYKGGTEIGYVPLFTKDGYLFFFHRDTGDTSANSDDSVKVYCVTIDQAKQESLSIFNEDTEVTVYLDGVDITDTLTFMRETANYTLDQVQLFFNLRSDDLDPSDPNKKIKHYGFINLADVDTQSRTITIHGGAKVHGSSGIFGDHAVRTYAENSDLETNNTPLADINHMYIISSDGKRIIHDITIEPDDNVQYENFAYGTDGEYFITYKGDDLYEITGNTYDSINDNFLSDQLYRLNNTMVTYEIPDGPDAGVKIGYIYEEGIYINPGSGEPVFVDINDDNDFITSCWIGRSGRKYLMATQETGFWVIELAGTDYADSSVMRFDPERDGNLSEYL